MVARKEAVQLGNYFRFLNNKIQPHLCLQDFLKLFWAHGIKEMRILFSKTSFFKKWFQPDVVKSHLSTYLHTLIMFYKQRFISNDFLTTVFPHIVSAETILF